jgi:hypothetical protein
LCYIPLTPGYQWLEFFDAWLSNENLNLRFHIRFSKFANLERSMGSLELNFVSKGSSVLAIWHPSPPDLVLHDWIQAYIPEQSPKSDELKVLFSCRDATRRLDPIVFV